MTLKLKSLLVEQPVSMDKNAALIQILQTQRGIFESTLAKLKSADYSATSDILKDNAVAVCQAYVEYCENTLGTIKQYPDASVEDAVMENVYTMMERIKDSLTY
jgi:hypothetical protein